MIVTLIIIGVIILIIAIFCMGMDASGLGFLLGVLGAYLFSGGIMMWQESFKPTAMNVYQGKTTLETTYKDGVPVDSIVVFRNK